MEQESPRPTRVRHRVMGMLCALSFLTYFDRVCIMRAADDIQRDLALSDVQMGWVFSAFWFAYAIFEIPGGWMGDRFGARITLTRIVLAWSIFTALSGSATGFLTLLTCRFLFGVGEAGAYPNMARVQANWLSPKGRARAGGWLWLLARWGGAFAPFLFDLMLIAFRDPGVRDFLSSIPLMGFLKNVEPWRMGFWASGFVGIAWCLLFYPWFRDDPAQHRGVNEAELAIIRQDRTEAVQAKHTMPGHAWKALFTSRSLWAIGCLYILGSFGWSFFVSWLPRYFKEIHGMGFGTGKGETEAVHQMLQRLGLDGLLGGLPPQTLTAIITGLPLLFGGIACLVGGALCDALLKRVGRKRLVRAIFPITGCVIAACAMLGVRLVERPEFAVLLMVLAAAAYDFGQASNWASIVDIGGKYAGTATGFINMVGNAGNYLQPVIGALIFSNFGWGPLFYVYAGCYLAAASMWLFIDPTKTFYDKPAAASEGG
ncbi:MAG: MFS transporter [Phycisphaeraceae bacterium]